MGDNFTSNQEAIIDYARFSVSKSDELEPWSSKNSDRYYPDASAFGAASDSANDVQYQYWPMTPEEYATHTGLSLDPHFDPGPGILDTAGGTVNDVAGWVAKWVAQPPVFALFGDTDSFNQQIGNWLYYYTARGPSNETSASNKTQSDPPWADKLCSDWKDAVDNRLFEVDEICREIAFIIPLLVLVAERYADTDLENATDLSSVAIPDRNLLER